jgi:hypothetical protein
VTARRDAVVATLLKRGLPVDQRLPAGGTALMIAAALGFPEIVALLLDHGARTNAQDERGTQALHAVGQFAFRSAETARAQRIIELLLKHGADVNARNGAGQTPLLLLLGARAEPGTTADQKHLLVLLRQLLVAGGRQCRISGVSALHARCTPVVAARVLLQHGRYLRRCADRSVREAHLLGYTDVDAEIRSRSRRQSSAAQCRNSLARALGRAGWIRISCRLEQAFQIRNASFAPCSARRRHRRRYWLFSSSASWT